MIFPDAVMTANFLLDPVPNTGFLYFLLDPVPNTALFYFFGTIADMGPLNEFQAFLSSSMIPKWTRGCYQMNKHSFLT